MIIDEKFFQFLWKEQLIDLKNLRSVSGKRIQIIDPGTMNIHGGPDFLQANIQIDGLEFHGSIELHIKSSMWNYHGHQHDSNYDNVILHVVLEHDKDVFLQSGGEMETIALKEVLNKSYLTKLHLEDFKQNKGVCGEVIQEMTSLNRLSFLDSLFIERLEEKVKMIQDLKERKNYCWSKTLLHTLAKHLSFSNASLMEDWGEKIQIRDLLQIRSRPDKVSSYLFGSAGMLEAVEGDEYYLSLKREYDHIKRKYQIDNISTSLWNRGGVRVYNHPNRVIGFLSSFVHHHLHSWQSFMDSFSLETIQEILLNCDSDYWKGHYGFGKRLMKENQFFTDQKINLLLVNVFIPIYVAIKKQECSSEFLEELMSLKPESNSIVKAWSKRGVDIRSLWDGQAILQLDKQYCSRNKCLSCRVGRSILKDAKIDYQNKKANRSPVLWGLSVVG